LDTRHQTPANPSQYRYSIKLPSRSTGHGYRLTSHAAFRDAARIENPLQVWCDVKTPSLSGRKVPFGSAVLALLIVGTICRGTPTDSGSERLSGMLAKSRNTFSRVCRGENIFKVPELNWPSAKEMGND
jgi:hypothetical protein